MTNPEAVRLVIHDLLVSTYGSIRAAAPRVGLPHKTLHRMFTRSEGDRSKEISFDKVMLVISALNRDDPKITFSYVFDQASKLS